MDKVIPNNYREKPIEFYKAMLSGMDPESIAARCGLKHDDSSVFVTVLGCDYRIKIPSFEYEKLTADKPDFMAAQRGDIELRKNRMQLCRVFRQVHLI